MQCNTNPGPWSATPQLGIVLSFIGLSPISNFPRALIYSILGIELVACYAEMSLLNLVARALSYLDKLSRPFLSNSGQLR